MSDKKKSILDIGSLVNLGLTVYSTIAACITTGIADTTFYDSIFDAPSAKLYVRNMLNRVPAEKLQPCFLSMQIPGDELS